MHFFTLAAALLIPLVIDSALFEEAVQATPKVLFLQAQNSGNNDLDDIERLEEEAKQALEAGNYQKAIEIVEGILVIQEKELGEEHLDTATSLYNLAFLYDKQGLYDKEIGRASCRERV